MKKNDNLETPKWVIDQLGEIDLDPCAGPLTKIAKTNWSIHRGENGLERPWDGFVFCNPPFSEKSKWIERMIEHNNGILLLPERGSAPWFGPLAKAAGKYWIMGKKINFIGGSSSNNVGSAFFLFGDEAEQRLRNCALPGHMAAVSEFRPRR